jgi:hypothetical protein
MDHCAQCGGTLHNGDQVITWISPVNGTTYAHAAHIQGTSACTVKTYGSR